MGDHQFGSFTQGIIDLLINTTGEFVTERNKTAWTTCAPLHNVLFGQYVYLATEQAETYLKICVLIYHLTFICPSLFDCEVNTFFFHFCEFQTLNLQFPPCYSPVSTTGLQNIAPYQLLGYNCASVSATARGYDSLMFGFF